MIIVDNSTIFESTSKKEDTVVLENIYLLLMILQF